MISVCPGCGLELPSEGTAAGGRHNSSPECWRLFGELSAYTLTHGDPRFIHQHAVDAWQLQHAQITKSNIGIAFSLVGLYLACEKGRTGRAAQLAHMELGKTKRNYGDFVIPKERAPLTVLDVLNVPPGPGRDAKLMEWARAVWMSWPHAHAWTAELCARLLRTT